MIAGATVPSGTDASGDPRASRSAAFVAVLVLGLALRLLCFTGYHGADDELYIERAFALSEGDRSLPTGAWQGRLGVVGPTALAYRVLGVTPVTTNLFPLACSLAGLVVAFVIGTRLVGRRAAVLAALVLAIFPLDVLFAGQLFPTAPVILLAGTGLGLFVLAERDRSTRLYFASGACLGLALVVHEGAVMGLAFYPVYLACGRAPTRAHVWILVGLLLGVALDPLLHAWLCGDPLARLAGIRASHAAMLGGVAPDVAYAGLNRSWLGEGVLRPFVERTFGLFPWVLVAAWWVGLRAPRQSPARALAIIVGVGTVWIYFGTTSPTHYSPMSRMPRYLAPLVLPGAWLLGWFLDQRTPRLRSGLVWTLGITSLACLALDSGNTLPPYDQASDVLRTLKATDVVAEKVRPLRFAEGMRPAYRLAELPQGTPGSGTFVVVRVRRGGQPVVDLAGARHVVDVVAPSNLYRRALGNDVVMGILRATRPPARFVEYAEKVQPPTLAIYRME